MRNFTNSKRIAIKIGTNTLSRAGKVDSAYIRSIAAQVAELIKAGRQAVLISSGAIGMGAGRIGLLEAAADIKTRQALAAIGQPLLMTEYRKAFDKLGLACGQVLLTAEVLSNRKTYLNLKNAIETLLTLGVVPILNENDCVSTAEIGTAFGDNDKLSALVASKLDADVLIILSDIDCLYDKDPRKFPDAKPVKAVYEITDEILKSAGAAGSKFSTGGMKTKIAAAQIAANAGCRIVLANGRTKNVITKIIAGSDLGTVFMPRRKLCNRLRWLLNSAPAGTITIDDGAAAAIRKKKSLLPKGIKSISGNFRPGDVVMLNSVAKAVCNFSSDELAAIIGRHSSEIKAILGSGKKDVVATPENIVFLDY
ncbi:MAG TPA: glutamate 5-kinase [Phycisphaerales bacterium]|nr:MAG: glutamate 5-kinase [Planctomycetes bacterium GWC2_45_44]HBG78022.1 glutamate 5-kinase [Phycisphaerales bacterium]HBR18699.1 glutamate 5-kinase [Phycisphaerales bacterium]